MKIVIHADHLSSWGGGRDFLKNIIINPLMLRDNEIIVMLSDNVYHRSIIGDYEDGYKGKLQVVLTKNDVADIYDIEPDVVMCAYDKFYDMKFPKVYYVPDCQHLYYPNFFTNADKSSRDFAFFNMVHSGDAIINNSRNAKNDLVKFYEAPEEKVFNFPYCNYFNKEFLEDNPSLLDKYSLTDNYFLICNQFFVHKDHITAIKAMKHLIKERPDCILVCTGDPNDFRFPKYQKFLKDLIKKNGLEGHVKFTGFLPKEDQVEMIKNAVAIVQPTLYEGGAGGGSVLSAVSYGVRSIVSDIEINKELDGIKDINFFRTGDEEDLAKKMLELLNTEHVKSTKEERLKEFDVRQRAVSDCLYEAIEFAKKEYKRKVKEDGDSSEMQIKDYDFDKKLKPLSEKEIRKDAKIGEHVSRLEFKMVDSMYRNLITQFENKKPDEEIMVKSIGDLYFTKKVRNKKLKNLFCKKSKNNNGAQGGKVTIVTACINLVKGGREEYFEKMFETVQAQTYGNIEHLIIDGASKDGTVAFIQDLVDRKAHNHEVRIVSEPDTGIYNAFNKGIKKAKGDYVIYMNSDDYYYRENAIELLVNRLEATKADFAFGEARLERPVEVAPEGFIRLNSDLNIYPINMPFCHQTMLTTKKLLKKLGGFSEKYRLASDYELVVRAMKKKAKGVKVNSDLVFFRYDGASVDNYQLSHKEIGKFLKKLLYKKENLTRAEIIEAHTTSFPGVAGSDVLIAKIKEMKNEDLKKTLLKYVANK